MHIFPIHSQSWNYQPFKVAQWDFITAQKKKDKIKIIFPAHLPHGYIHFEEMQP